MNILTESKLDRSIVKIYSRDDFLLTKDDLGEQLGDDLYREENRDRVVRDLLDRL